MVIGEFKPTHEILNDRAIYWGQKVEHFDSIISNTIIDLKCSTFIAEKFIYYL